VRPSLVLADRFVFELQLSFIITSASWLIGLDRFTTEPELWVTTLYDLFFKYILFLYVLLAVMRLWFLVLNNVAEPCAIDTNPNDQVSDLTMAIHGRCPSFCDSTDIRLYKVNMARPLSTRT
jgi:hypothetical protein